MVNKAIIIGNLGADPELRYTSGGNAVADLRVATTFKAKGKEETEWHRVTVWGKQAEACKEYLAKGRQVYVEGRLQTRKWDDRDGNTRYTTEICAERVQFLGGKGKPASGGRPAPDYAPAPPPDDDDLPF